MSKIILVTNISKTVNRSSVPKDHQWEMANGELNGGLVEVGGLHCPSVFFLVIAVPVILGDALWANCMNAIQISSQLSRMSPNKRHVSLDLLTSSEDLSVLFHK